MVPRGTKLKPNVVEHLENGTSHIMAKYKGAPVTIIIDTADWPEIQKYTWYVEKAKRTLYASTKTGGWYKDKPHVRIRLHRLLHPDSKQVDHKDGDGLNNRRCNLRPASSTQNSRNRRKNTKPASSPFIGVCIEKRTGKWQSGIKYNNKRHSLGNYTTQEEAALVRDIKAMEIFGDFAHLNFPVALVQEYKDTKEYMT